MAIDATIKQLLMMTSEQKTSVYFAGDGLEITFQTHILEVGNERLIIENKIKPEYINRVLDSKNFFLQVQMVRFVTANVASDGVNLVFQLDENSLIEETRGSERFPFSSEEHVICEILNPFDNETRLSKSVMDMSATGLSLRTTYESELFKPGVHLPDLRVLIDGDLYTQAAGQVVYRRKLIDLKGDLKLQIGVQFEKVDNEK